MSDNDTAPTTPPTIEVVGSMGEGPKPPVRLMQAYLALRLTDMPDGTVKEDLLAISSGRVYRLVGDATMVRVSEEEEAATKVIMEEQTKAAMARARIAEGLAPRVLDPYDLSRRG